MKLIDKSALVAKIERWIELLTNEKNQEGASQIDKLSLGGRIAELQEVETFINTLEVKEVDYERELSKYLSDGIHRFFPNVGDDYCKMDSIIWQDYVIETAKYFFELGLKTQKGE